MKRVLLLLHEYYPNPSAITNCLYEPIRYMLKHNITVDVLTRRTILKDPKYEIIDNVNVYRLNDYYNLLSEKIDDLVNNKKNIIIIVFYKIMLKFFWLYKKNFKKKSFGFINILKYSKFCQKLIKNNNVDVIISCSYPFSLHEVGYNVKKKLKVTWIAYQFDPFTYNFTMNTKYKIKDRLKKEISILLKANKIFILEENYKQNINSPLKILKDKYFITPLPLIKKPTVKINNNIDKTIIFAFTGSIYKGIREPFEMLDIISNFTFDYKIVIYCRVNEEDIRIKLDSYIEKFKSNLIVKYNCSKKESDELLANCNIILNIGNSIVNQTPSKVFELISLGKPILNFYSIENDTSKNILKKYPCCLHINTKRKINVSKLNTFCLNNKDITLSFEKATKNYLNAEKASKIIVNKIIKIDESRKTNEK